MKLLQTQFFMQAVISSWLNLEKTIFKPEKKRNYIRHEWSFVTFKICGVLCPRTEKTLLLRKVKEAQVAVTREKGRERYDNSLFNKLWVFDIFMLLPAIIMQYFYDSVEYALKVWVSFNIQWKEFILYFCLSRMQ